ncbi:MAG: acetylornithine carbamoyltransferase [Flavobacteriales bacterium]
MIRFTSVHDVPRVDALVQQALRFKQDPWSQATAGARRTLGLVFMNPSLRTRISTQKAAEQLGLNVMVMNVNGDGWALEFEDGVVMDGTKVEHVREAAAVLGTYCDIIGLRSFPGLVDRDADYAEQVMERFIASCRVPFVSLESATRHPLQSLADVITIAERKRAERPKVVLTWAPHIKALPQAVANSFAEWVLAVGHDLTIANPTGFDLDPTFTQGATITHDQEAALEGADFVYVKNWSSFADYGRVHPGAREWMLTPKHLKRTNDAGVMHCLPVRRDLELAAAVLDGPSSLVLQQADNRTWAAQAVLHELLKHTP